MKIILNEDVKGKGKKGEIIEVSDSYARNVIISKGLGVEATKQNLNSLKLKKANEERIAKEEYENALKLKEFLEKSEVSLKVKVGKNGQVFGSITNKEISNAIKEQLKIDIDKKKIIVEENIKFLGDVPFKLNVKVKLHNKVVSNFTINVYKE